MSIVAGGRAGWHVVEQPARTRIPHLFGFEICSYLEAAGWIVEPPPIPPRRVPVASTQLIRPVDRMDSTLDLFAALVSEHRISVTGLNGRWLWKCQCGRGELPLYDTRHEAWFTAAQHLWLGAAMATDTPTDYRFDNGLAAYLASFGWRVADPKTGRWLVYPR